MNPEFDESRSNREHLIDHLCRLFAGVWRFKDSGGEERFLYGDAVDAVMALSKEQVESISGDAYFDLVKAGTGAYAKDYFRRALTFLRAHEDPGAPGIFENPEDARQHSLQELFKEWRSLEIVAETWAPRIKEAPPEAFSPEAQAERLEAELRAYFVDVVPAMLDLIFAYEFLQRLESMVDRFKRGLDARHMLVGVPERVNEYMGEAARAFRHGFDKACIAMCRSGLEEALRVYIRETYGQRYLSVSDENFKDGEVGLQSMIVFAFDTKKFLSHSLRESAQKIRVEGNGILHGRYSETELEDLAREILFSTRLILSHLFKSRPAESD